MKQRLLLGAAAIVAMLIAGSILGYTPLTENLKSCIMVLGGTLISAMLGFPLATFVDLWHSLKNTQQQGTEEFKITLADITRLARIRRSAGPRELNDEGDKASNPFLRKGIDLIVDGYTRHEIHFIMEKEYDLYFSHKESQINILNTMAKISPALGFMGTVIALINILHNVSDASAISKGMSLALLTTLYSLLFTNFIFLPLARKLAEQVKSEAALLNIILEGILGIAEAKNPAAISHRLESYLESNNQSMQRLKDLLGKEPGSRIRFILGSLKESEPDALAEQ